MVVVTNGFQDKGENGTHFILVKFIQDSQRSQTPDQTNKPDMKPHAPQIQNPDAVSTSDSTTTRAGHGS